MSTPTNKALYLPSKQAPNFQVKSAPYPTVPANSIVVRNHAIAINPIDWLIKDKGNLMYTHLAYPFILGIDVSGEVIQVGSGVTGLKVGDRVLGYARSSDPKVNNSAEGAFQEYVVLKPELTTRIPDWLEYKDACVIPLGIATAAAGLFQKDQMALQYPTVPPISTGKTIIVWGGSTSVGSNAIQLGVAAGYEVFTTASPPNFEYTKKLGACRVFDYKSKTVVADLTAAMKGKTAAGALVCGHGGGEACMAVLEKSKGNKFIAIASFPMPEKDPESFVMLRTIYGFASWTIAFKANGLRKGVKSNFINAASVSHNEVGKAIFGDYLPKALEAGSFVAAPDAHVFGHGIESISGACDYQKMGVSARKVVVTL